MIMKPLVIALALVVVTAITVPAASCPVIGPGVWSLRLTNPAQAPGAICVSVCFNPNCDPWFTWVSSQSHRRRNRDLATECAVAPDRRVVRRIEAHERRPGVLGYNTWLGAGPALPLAVASGKGGSTLR